MNETTFQSLSIESVVTELGLSAIRQGAGLARLKQDQDFLPHSINLDANTFHHENGEEGGSIELVMAVLSCDKKEAIAWFKKQSKKRQEKIEIIETEIHKLLSTLKRNTQEGDKSFIGRTVL